MQRRAFIAALGMAIAAPAAVRAESLFRSVMTGGRILYVRLDGSDLNDGSADDAAHAFATGQAAIDYAAQYIDTGRSALTIQFSDESEETPHTAGMSLRTVPGAGTVIIQGNISTPRNCPLFVSNNFPVNYPGGFTVYLVRGFWIKAFTSGYGSLRTTEMGRLKFDAIDFGITGHAHIIAARSGHNFCNGNYVISGGGLSHMYSDEQGLVHVPSRTITASGNPVFSQAFARATGNSNIIAPANIWAGDYDTSASTKKFSVEGKSYIGTNDAGANYFPGGVAGTSSADSTYA